MCKLKSGILLKDDVFVPDYDSHTQMLEELKIKDTQQNAERLFIRFELYPANGDVFSPVDTWEYQVDQDIIPEWYVEEVDKERAIKAVKVWADKHILIGKTNIDLMSSTYYIKDSTVTACDSATVTACDSATVKAYDSATVKAYDSATVKAYDSATVKAYGSATAIIPDWSSNRRENIVISQNATIKDCKTKTIWQSGDWKIEVVKGVKNK